MEHKSKWALCWLGTQRSGAAYSPRILISKLAYPTTVESQEIQ